MPMERGIADEGLKRVAKQVKAQEEGYQGWKNYETWAVALWLDNDQGSYEYWRETLAELREESQDQGLRSEFTPESVTDDDLVRYELAERLKDYHDEMASEMGLQDQGVFSDLLNAALSEVDWNEIAENIMAE